MGGMPIKILAVIIMTLTFEGLLFGEQIAERSFPTLDEPTTTGFWGALDALIAVVRAIWGAVVFFFNLLTFNVPGAPWWIRLPVGSVLGGGLLYSVTVIVRGGGDT